MSLIRFTLADGRKVACSVEPLGAGPFNEFVRSLQEQLTSGTLVIAHQSGEFPVIDFEVVEGEHPAN